MQMKSKSIVDKTSSSSKTKYGKPPTFKYNSLNMAKSIQGYIKPSEKEFDNRIKDPRGQKPVGGMWNK